MEVAITHCSSVLLHAQTSRRIKLPVSPPSSFVFKPSDNLAFSAARTKFSTRTARRSIWTPGSPVAFITTFVTLFALVIAITKDLPDVEGDRQYRFCVTKLGVRNIALLGSGLLLINYIGSISAAFYMPQAFRRSLMIPAHSILALGLTSQAWVLEKANYSKRHISERMHPLSLSDAISEFYHFIWNLFYAEYLIFPFI